MDSAPADSGGWDPGDLAGLDTSNRSLIRTVDSFDPEALAAPSLLPGWSRAHVVAHLALNAVALTGVVEGVLRRERVAMYESDAARDAAVEQLAAAGPPELREQLLAATTAFDEAVARLDGEDWEAGIDRLPGGPTWPMVTLVPSRRREVEIHHADLGASYTRGDWPDDFVIELLDAVVADHGHEGPFRVRATDLGRTWAVGTDLEDPEGPIVMGLGADLGWWLTGRGEGEGLSCDGPLPMLGPWRRVTAQAVPGQAIPGRGA